MKPRFAFDPEKAVAHLLASDETFGKLINRIGPFTLELMPESSMFEALLRSIIYQQLHGKAAGAIHNRVLAALSQHGGVEAKKKTKISDAILREAGLSANKLLAMRDLALKCDDKTIPTFEEAHKFSDDELVMRLTAVRGIGAWTVHMVLIFHMGRPNVLPTGDFAIRQAFKKLYGKRKDPTHDAIIKQARRWQPYRSVASWYLWRSIESD